MLIHREFGTIARLFEYFSLLINGGSVASISCVFEDSPFLSRWMKFARDGCSAAFGGVPLKPLDQLFGTLSVGVVFFPSLPFMGVMLFPSFWLGNACGEGGASFALLSLFLSLSSSSSSFLPLLFSFLPLFLYFLPFLPSHSSSSSASTFFYISISLSFPSFRLSPLSFASFSCSLFFLFISISLSFPSFCLSPLSFASFSCSLFFFFFWRNYLYCV